MNIYIPFPKTPNIHQEHFAASTLPREDKMLHSRHHSRPRPLTLSNTYGLMLMDVMKETNFLYLEFGCR